MIDAAAGEEEVLETTQSLPEGDYSVHQQFRLEVVEGPDRGAHLVSDGARTVVGSHASADLTLSDPAVSRFHCELVARDERVDIADLGSRNGTRVNDVAIEAAHLGSAASIRIGRSVLRFERVGRELRVPIGPQQRFGRLVGRSAPMRQVFAGLDRAARSDATLLLTGETGTGKDAVARSVHESSDRRGGPFVVVDCGAIAPTLIESELFGHERGAFTGADQDRPGAFERASGGTLFLDEIGELELELQPKLLRALDARAVQRVGGGAAIPVDVRVVAATNRDLRTEVNQKRFRSDLFYRLAVVELALPPLRERLEDLPLLVEDLLGSLGAAGRPMAQRLLDAEFLRGLERHLWPGNVRELRNHIERCLTFDDRVPVGGVVNAVGTSPDNAALPPVDIDTSIKQGREEWVKYFERQYIAKLLDANGGNVTAAARAAGVDRGHFYRLMFRCGLRGGD